LRARRKELRRSCTNGWLPHRDNPFAAASRTRLVDGQARNAEGAAASLERPNDEPFEGSRKCEMTCEEFETIGLDAGRDVSLAEALRVAAGEHVASCGRCAALRDSWEAARLELRALAQDTAALETPPRVEMRLRQRFRTQYHAP